MSPGLRYLIFSAVSFSLMAGCVKQLGVAIPSQQIAFIRSVWTLLFCVITLFVRGIRPWGTLHKLLVLRGVVGTLGLSGYFYGITQLPLAESSVIQQTTPVFVIVIAAIWLKETIRPVVVVALLLSLCGVLLVTKPAFLFGRHIVPLDALGTIAAFLGAIFSALAYIVIRAIKGREDPHVTVFYFPLVAVPVLLPIVVGGWVWPNFEQWLWLFGVGLFTQAAQVFMTVGLATEQAGLAATLSPLQLVFNVAIACLWFGESLDGWTILGSLIVVTATVGLAVISYWRRSHDLKVPATRQTTTSTF